MLYMASDSSKLLRLQGCYVSDRELDKLTAHWKEQAPPAEVQAASNEPSRTPVSAPPIFGMPPKAPSDDELADQAIEIIRQNNKASVSLLQRKLRIGYSRAARLIELLEERGIVGPDAGPTKGRTIIEATPARVKQARVAKPAHAKTSEDDEFVDWTEKDWQDLDKD